MTELIAQASKARKPVDNLVSTQAVAHLNLTFGNPLFPSKMQEYTLKRCVEVEVNCSVDEVYSLWDNLENMPKWMPLVKEVKVLPEAEYLSRWRFGLGGLLQTEWTSRITERIPPRSIKWESISGVPNCGCAQFFPIDRGCRLRLTLAFNLPGGIPGALIKGVGVERWLEDNLQQSLIRFKALIEAEVSRKAG